MARSCAHAELDSGVPSERNYQDAKRGHDNAHGDVWHFLGIHLSALKFKATVVPGEQTSEPNEHLPERWVHIKVKLALEVIRAKLAKMRLVPDDDGRLADLVEPGPAREKGVHGGGDVFEVLLDELALLGGEGGVVIRLCERRKQRRDVQWKLEEVEGLS
jgi:hypothetical protein